MDLGECPKIHDLALRADFEKAQQSKDYFYDLDVSRASITHLPLTTVIDRNVVIAGDGTFTSLYR